MDLATYKDTGVHGAFVVMHGASPNFVHTDIAAIIEWLKDINEYANAARTRVHIVSAEDGFCKDITEAIAEDLADHWSDCHGIDAETEERDFPAFSQAHADAWICEALTGSSLQRHASTEAAADHREGAL